jgi:putative nucleotidyltransferase with HDIG domain
MPDKQENAAVASQQVELAIRRLECLSTLACIAAQFLPRLLQSQFHPSALLDMIESDPALSTKILSLISRRGVGLHEDHFSLGRALGKLPAHEVRHAILSIGISHILDENSDSSVKKGLLLHSIATACCCKEIAEMASPRIDPQLAYYAGLLHDIGKLALDETMPKSFARILDQAKERGQCTQRIEQEFLGMDHTIIGKRLAQKWQFPNSIMLAIWLHHSRTVTISQDMPETRIASVVQLADSLARQSGIGSSGSFDLPEPIGPIAEALEISLEQIQRIQQNLNAKVEPKSEILGLDSPGAREKYCRIVHDAVIQLDRRETELSDENRRLQNASSHLDFTKDLLLQIHSNTAVVDVAENLATRWQRFYQTGRICLFLAPQAGSDMLEAVTVENLAQTQILTLTIPDETPVIPEPITNQFAIVNAHDYLDWLFEQLDFSFDANQTKLAPLLCGGKAVGAIAFEIHYPSDAAIFEESFRTSASIAGAVLALTMARRKQQQFAERFARLISVSPQRQPLADLRSKIEQPPQTTLSETSMDALAEMASGAAHELNNPLAVISGRAQLLAEAENNQEKKQILEQIHENANEASEIIEDLMSFAEPPQPRPAAIDIPQMIEEAKQLAARKTNLEELDIQIEIADGIENIFVDSAQIVSAVANIISNAVESYGDQAGPIEIAAKVSTTTDKIELSITDHGCGMDSRTLQKAIQPFFSARPAGRKRGMGLAYAARLIQLNKGSLNIQSELGAGTTVNIYLPRR